MIHTIAEFLFYLTGGVPITTALWIFPYIFVVMVIIIVFLSIITYYNSVKDTWWGLLGIIPFIVVFFIAVGTPIDQHRMLIKECNDYTVDYDTGNVSGQKIVTECLVKYNYYDDEYFWKEKK